MKTQVMTVIIGMLVMTGVGYGQATSTKKDERTSPDMLAKQLVDDVKHNRPPQGRQLRGRDDVLPELQKMTDGLSKNVMMGVLQDILCIGMEENQTKWIFSSAVTAYLVQVAISASDGEVRERAGDLLVSYVPASYIRVHATALIKANKEGKLCNARLLGMTGAEEAKQLLQKGGGPWNGDEVEVRAALAKLGDTAASKRFVEEYQAERDPRKKAELAKTLGYIGDAASILALARDMRTSVIYIDGGCEKSLRVDLIAALSEAYPHESVFWWRHIQGFEEIDKWYDAIEKWLEGHLGITWKTPRPKPFTAFPLLHPVSMPHQ